MALRFWNFELRKHPTEILRRSEIKKKSWGKKKVINTTPKKGTSTAFCAGSLAPNKKVGVEQGEVAQVILDSA
jgi:hypothetical protein